MLEKLYVIFIYFKYYILCSYIFQGATVDFPPNKLKQGYGEQALFVLDKLADAALKAIKFQWKK